MNDSKTTLQDLKDHMALFVRERDWEQFHTPKNLAMSIAIEAAELMEHFQWLTVEDSKQLKSGPLVDVGEELADIIIYSLSLSNTLGLDLSQIVLDKMAKNNRKYPSEKVRGKSHKYTYYQDDDDSQR
jgi:NTP pyrophosphatase (non-canonical NTP hydrolase)